MAVGKLYAFWKYDDFPYVCGGVVDEMRDDGRVQVPSFGKGSWFLPIKLLPEAAGEALHQKLRELKLDRDNRLAEVRMSYDSLLALKFPEACAPSPKKKAK